MFGKRLVSLFFVFTVTSFAIAGPDDWTNLAHTPQHSSIAVDGPNQIDASTLQWINDFDPQDPNYFVSFESYTAPVVHNGKVYAYAKYFNPNEGFDYTNSQIVAYDSNSGQIEWSTPVDLQAWDSASSPCVDTKHNTVLMGSGNKVFCLDAQSGTQLWAAQLEKVTVNASVCTATDLPNARAFAVDYDGFGITGKIYCINLDPNTPENPYQPGQIIWSDTIGQTTGNTPAYKNGVVYVTSLSSPTNFNGNIYAYDATAATPVKIWQTTDPNFDTFSGGVTVTKEGYLYAVSYDWNEEFEDNSQLCKIDCTDGNIVWMIDAERSNSIPIVVGDKIYISGGIADDPSPDKWWEGSRPKVEAYQDNGPTATKLWETPESMVVGGWTSQAAYADGKLYVGAIPLDGDAFGAYTDLYILDLSKEPNEPNFIIAHYNDFSCGNSPAVTYDSIYTLGAGRLVKFKQPALLGDIEEDNAVDSLDLSSIANLWLLDRPIGTLRCDLDLDGMINMTDLALLANDWNTEIE